MDLGELLCSCLTGRLQKKASYNAQQAEMMEFTYALVNRMMLRSGLKGGVQSFVFLHLKNHFPIEYVSWYPSIPNPCYAYSLRMIEYYIGTEKMVQFVAHIKREIAKDVQKNDFQSSDFSSIQPA